jgi:hypothetical protein
MKHSFLLLFFLSCFCITKAQDTIRFRDGKTVIAIIQQVEETRIQYHLYNYSDGPLFIKNLNSILWIRYKNGVTDSFTIRKPEPMNPYLDSAFRTEGQLFTDKQIDSIAYLDATKYYSGAAPATGIFAATILASPVTGLIATLAANATPPKDHNLNVPGTPISKSPGYYNAYKAKAYEIKRDRVTTNFVGGLIINLMAAFAYLVFNSK